MESIINISGQAWWWLGTIFLFFGIISAIQAIMETRTPQGATAWVVALLLAPMIAVPLFWIFGRRRFRGYKKGLEIFSQARSTKIGREITESFDEANINLHPLFEKKNAWQEGIFAYFSEGNTVKLLINGEQSFNALFDILEKAEHYILIQYYIVRDDAIGKKLKSILIRKAQSGVRVAFLFDPFGSGRLRQYTRELQEGGVMVYPFSTRKGKGNFFQFNFRNHRKITVIDGKTAFTGGMNIGDEYLGRDTKTGFWRDTNIQIEGPVVTLLQYTFQRDWYFATGKNIDDLLWRPTITKGHSEVLVIPTSPATLYEHGTLFFLHLINSAKKRIWICNPYFVPDEQFVSALQIASLRGVEIKIITPMHCNSFLVRNSAYAIMRALSDFENIEWREYKNGFMHQKVMLIDDDLALVGTHNFDSRSFRLNFEVSALVRDKVFYQEVKTMIEKDFEETNLVPRDVYQRLPFHHKLLVRAIYLFSPIA